MGERYSDHFLVAEFTCDHCEAMGDGGMDPRLIDILEDIRTRYAQPVVIKSGYRCPTHNANVGGASNSQHLKCTAADIQVKNVAPTTVQAYVDQKYGNGVSQGYYGTFTHIDTRSPSGARWWG